MKTILLLLILAATINLSGQNYGYLVVVSTQGDKNTKCLKTSNLDVVSNVFKNRFGYSMDFKKSFSGKNMYVDHRSSFSYFYCEKKLIVKARNGKARYVKINRKRLKKHIRPPL